MILFSHSSLFGILSANFLIVSPVLAQIVPDRTLPINSRIVEVGNEVSIEDGTTVNNLLFHSFSEFSIPADTVARFNNLPNIETIFSRVTGNDISRIDGTLAANGGASLFLINPNGIVFGENARLDLGGSFFASTAEGIWFDNGSQFSTVAPNADPLLTVSVPVGVQFGETPGDIVNRSSALSPIPGLPEALPTATGLTVQPGRTLALLGGNVRLESGDLTAFQGDIQLASVNSPDRLNIFPTATGIEFDGSSIERWGTIDVSGTASVNTSGLGGGSIRLRGGDVLVRDNARIVSATLGDIDGRSISIEAERITLRDGMLLSTATFGTGRGGNLQLRASESVDLIGAGFPLLLQLEIQAALGTLDVTTLELGTLAISDALGDAGDVRIETERLSLRNGAILISVTSASGNSGNLEIQARDTLEVDESFVSTGAVRGTTGNAGNLTIETQTLRLTDSGIVNAITLGAGNGGDLSVVASDSIEIFDRPLDALLLPSGLFTQTAFGTGNGGNIDVRTRHLSIGGGGQVNAQSGERLGVGSIIIPSGGLGGNINIEATDSIEIVGVSANGQFRSGITTNTLSEFPASNIAISTGELIIRDGAAIEAAALNRGRGGNISISVDRIELSGTSDPRETSVNFPSRLGASSGREDFRDLVASGAAGDVQVRAGEIVVRDGARITVTSLGTGDAGSLDIEADALFLDNGGQLDAATVSGTGGNLRVRAAILQLRQNSLISTNAGNADGGNIALETDTLVALDNSDITANALQGRGGRVEITSQGIFGTAFRDSLTPESDITATSDLGPAFSGIVELSTPEVNTEGGFVELSEEFVEVSGLVVDSCAAVRAGSRFVVVGRSGMSWNTPEYATVGMLPIWEPQPLPSRSSEEPLSEELLNLQEATGWIVRDDGRVELVEAVK
ncbi:MAG: S-layer family protein [Cyanobacteria bacterium SID2]|nr:S-layer family protein [Cyanobacteria bacterium SID2]MBP0003325.1 S-layer family protein [Cyanobacteria bacterium SBC]